MLTFYMEEDFIDIFVTQWNQFSGEGNDVILGTWVQEGYLGNWNSKQPVIVCYVCLSLDVKCCSFDQMCGIIILCEL